MVAYLTLCQSGLQLLNLFVPADHVLQGAVQIRHQLLNILLELRVALLQCPQAQEKQAICRPCRLTSTMSFGSECSAAQHSERCMLDAMKE